MKTGQDVMEPGLYVSECCGEEVMLAKDASFPRCRKCSGLSTYEMVDIPEEKAAESLLATGRNPHREENPLQKTGNSQEERRYLL